MLGNKKTLLLAIACALALLFARTTGAGEGISSRADLDDNDAAQLVKLARLSMKSAVAGTPLEFGFSRDSRLGHATNEVYIFLMKNGKVAAGAGGGQSSLEGNLRVAASRAAAAAGGEKPEELPLALSLLLAEDEPPAGVPPVLYGRTTGLGLHWLKAEYMGFKKELPPLEPMLRGWDWEASMLALARQLNPVESASGKTAEDNSELVRKILVNPEFKLRRFASVSILSENPVATPAVIYRNGRLVRLADVNRQAVLDAISLALAWYKNNQKPDGSLPYQYDPLADQEPEGNDCVRETMNAAALGLLWSHTRDAAVRQLGLKALAAAMNKYYLEDPTNGMGYLRGYGEVSLGGAAAALLAIVRLRADADDETFKQRKVKLVTFLRAMQSGDGRFATVYPATESQSGGDTWPGDALLALLEAGSPPDQKAAAKDAASLAFYIEDFRNRVAEDRHPPYETVPRLTQAGVRVYSLTRKQETAAELFRMNRLLVATQQLCADGTSALWEDEKGRFFNPEKRALGKPAAANTASCVEGLADAFALARALGEEKLAADFRHALLWGVRDLLQLQVRDGCDTFAMPSPQRALGGFRTRIDNPAIRIDNMQYAVSALIKVAAVLNEADFRSFDDLKKRK